MSSKAERATELFKQGYNCAQAVFAAFSEDLGMDFETALRLSSSFGGGMGRLREVCGAISGMFAVAGMKYGYTDPKDNKAKAAHYKLIQELAAKFRAENGSIICRELLGLDAGPDHPIPESRTDAYYKKRTCAELVGCAARIMEELVNTETEECEMKVALPVESKSLEAPVCPSFGRTPLYVLIDTDSGTHEFLDNAAAASQGGAGIKAAQALVDSGVAALITYRCGENAAQVLNAAGIKIYKAQDGSVKNNIAAFKDGKLPLLTEIHPGFHGHGGGK